MGKPSIFSRLPLSRQGEIRAAVAAEGRDAMAQRGAWQRLADSFGIRVEALRRALDEPWAEERRQQINAQRSGNGRTRSEAMRDYHQGRRDAGELPPAGTPPKPHRRVEPEDVAGAAFFERVMGDRPPPEKRHWGPPVPKQAVPEDTRSTTGVLFGDPLPGRSALDQERAEAERLAAEPPDRRKSDGRVLPLISATAQLDHDDESEGDDA